MTEKDTQLPSANVALERLLEMAREAGLPKSEAVNQAHTTPSGVRPQIEVVADLLMAARMACSDLPPDARSALRTLLLVIAMLCKECFARKGPGSKETSRTSSRLRQWHAANFRVRRVALSGRCSASPPGN